MSFWTRYRRPIPEDYETEEEYEEALAAYEYAEDMAIDQRLERDLFKDD